MRINRNVVSNSTHLHIRIPEHAFRSFYQLVFVVSSVLIFITAASDAIPAFGNRTVFSQLDLKLEGNLAAWYSSMLLLLTGLAASAIATNVPSSTQERRQHGIVWAVLAAFFFGLSADEAAQLHEWVGKSFTMRFGDTPRLARGAYPAYAWLVVLLPLIICFLLGMKVAIKSLRVHNPSRIFALAGVTCWIGVLLAEFIEAQMARLSMERSFQGVLEEGLEIAGTTFFLVSCLEFLRYARTQRDAASANQDGRAAQS